MKPDFTREELEILLTKEEGGTEAADGSEDLLQEAFRRIRQMSEQVVQLREDLHRMQLKVDLLEERVRVFQDNKRDAQAAADKPDHKPPNRESGHPFEITRKEKFKKRRLF
jgi:uncharacterized coiled-coil protein SlyX